MMDSKIKCKLSWDIRGALEGPPLYLIILVVIAAVTIVAVFTYLSVLQTEELAKIEVYIDNQKVNPLETTEGTHSVYIVAIGDDGSRLEDVTVTLTGAGMNMAEKTDSNGRADFGTLKFTITSGTYDKVQIEATYEGGNGDTPVFESLLVNPS